ncbi:DUF305 domain-containing protein [Streptomyces parvulus]|uniref:DUF305 domain-containing protein n=1 Tax=Streptomyces parvulus TaxID=146923 RepID=UPI003455136C
MTRTSRFSRVKRISRATVPVAVTAAAAFALAACGGGGDAGHEGPHGAASASATTDPGGSAGKGAGEQAHNAQDVAFAQGMIPHHRQALEMARLAPGRSAAPGVADLAARVEKAQDPEITTMTGWLRAWGEKVPEPTGSMPGMDHSAHSGMPGMMGAQDMAKLEKATGRAFDTLFLTMMVEHHEGAVEMAETEKGEGRHAPAKALAGDIATAQRAEITEMNRLLGRD